jgi:glucose/arabinose dehydrogenase
LPFQGLILRSNDLEYQNKLSWCTMLLFRIRERAKHMHRLISLTITLLLSAVAAADEAPYEVTEVATFNEPWAMTFLPDGRLLVTEKRGRLMIVTQDGKKSRPVEDVPNVDYRGQGGLGDVILHPDYANNGLIYLSYSESGIGNVRGAAVARGRLDIGKTDSFFSAVEVIWRQNPKVTDDGHYGHRMAFDADGYLFISSGDRQKFIPAQQMNGNLGKIVRLHDDGSIPEDNPFYDEGDVTAQIWSLGHRNPLGLAFDSQDRLWISEMGPLHGDELNLVVKGANYGYPIVSEGDHYSGEEIPDHDTRPEFEAPKIAWIPTVAPGGMIFYSGDQFPQWQGSALLAGLAARSLILVEFDGDRARETARYPLINRIREVEQGPDGAVWVLEDRDGGRLLKLTPR